MSDINSSLPVITETHNSPFASLQPVSMTDVQLEDGFWKTPQQINQSITIPTQYELLARTGRLDNFLRAAGKLDKPFQGLVFNDSDVYKWLEAASWSLAYNQSEELRRQVDLIISLISAAQQKDGYLNTYFSLGKANERWTNLREKHELYCAGHLIQAAIAHFRTTRDEKLLEIAVRLADHIYSEFGPSRRAGTCGHPEVEMALVELYRTTGNKKYLDLAILFIDRRGRGLLGGSEYLIDHAPFRTLDHLVGHAVRALYLCSGAADIVLETGEQQLLKTLEHLWTHMVQQQIYITGGLGARYEGEAFGEPYELPNARAYAETCAAIASVMWNWRMFQIDGDPRYMELLEWTLYNAVLPGISLDGKQYFYVNPLRDDGNHRRQSWFECACCPPNISRTLAMLPGYIYSLSPAGIWVNLYAASSVNVKLPAGQCIKLHQKTAYPWDGRITIELTSVFPAESANDDLLSKPFSLFLRMPSWLDEDSVVVMVNGEPIDYPIHAGTYLEINSAWQSGDRIELELSMQVHYIESHPLVLENTGRIAIARGPLLYCLEEVDNLALPLSRIVIDRSCQAGVEYLPELLGGVKQLTCRARIDEIDPEWQGRLYRPYKRGSTQRRNPEAEIKCVPYFAWANRAAGAMQVWNSYQ